MSHYQNIIVTARHICLNSNVQFDMIVTSYIKPLKYSTNLWLPGKDYMSFKYIEHAVKDSFLFLTLGFGHGVLISQKHSHSVVYITYMGHILTDPMPFRGGYIQVHSISAGQIWGLRDILPSKKIGIVIMTDIMGRKALLPMDLSCNEFVLVTLHNDTDQGLLISNNNVYKVKFESYD